MQKVLDGAYVGIGIVFGAFAGIAMLSFFINFTSWIVDTLGAL